MLSLRDLTIKKTKELLLKKEFSAFELTREFLQFIEKNDPEINAYLHVLHDPALERASEVDVKIAKEEDPGILGGVPVAVKDNMLMRGVPATAASESLRLHRGAYNATAVDKLVAEGAVIVGKTNMDEFAMGSSNESSAFGPVKNPHDKERVPGGSSGGSAAAVAAHEAVATLGSDTGGSIRQPASFCGVVGLKPTYGAVSRYGLIALASSLDQIGPLTKTVEDATIVFRTIAGKDKNDATSKQVDYSKEAFEIGIERIKEYTVGIPKEYMEGDLDSEVQEGMEKARQSLESLGVTFREISLPHTKYATACYYIIMPAEASSNLARYDGIRYARLEKVGEGAKSLRDIFIGQKSSGFGDEVKRRVLLGTFVLSSGYYDAYYGRAQKVRALIKQDFDRAFEDVDIIFAPTSPSTAFKLGEKSNDPLAMYLSDIFTIPANLAGIPAVSIPVRDLSENSLPVGFQLMGKHFRETDILGLGMYYDKLFDV